MDKHIQCASCRFARQDTWASEYTQKRCGKCTLREDCEVCRGCNKRNGCMARKSRKYTQYCERRLNAICSQQKLKWAAYECGNPDSEYYRALLNITKAGDKLDGITWTGCAWGEPMERSVTK